MTKQTGFGVDIAARRADDLDKKLLGWVAARDARGHPPTVLDIGCGSGGLAYRLAQAGAQVTALDVVDYQTEITAYNQQLAVNVRPITFQQESALSYFKTVTVQYDCVVAQRVLHYVTYQEAVQLLTALTNYTHRLYISVTGVESAIGHAHPKATQPLEERSATLTPELQATFEIFEPICPYTNSEFSTLLQTTGWEILEQWTSAFGNHKAVTRLPNSKRG